MIKENEIETVIAIALLLILLAMSKANCEEQWRQYTWASDSTEVVVVQAINEIGITYTYQCMAVFESDRSYRLVSPEINKIDLLKANLTCFAANKCDITTLRLRK